MEVKYYQKILYFPNGVTIKLKIYGEFQIISGLLNNTVFSKHDEKSYAQINYYTEDKIGNREYKGMYIIANTEIEAVIKTSEYILKEMNENRYNTIDTSY